MKLYEVGLRIVKSGTVSVFINPLTEACTCGFLQAFQKTNRIAVRIFERVVDNGGVLIGGDVENITAIQKAHPAAQS